MGEMAEWINDQEPFPDEMDDAGCAQAWCERHQIQYPDDGMGCADCANGEPTPEPSQGNEKGSEA